MLWHVYQRVSKAQRIAAVWVLTDSEEVLDEASSWGANVLMTSEACPSGTARIASVINALEADIIVNVQGDEPLIASSVVDGVVEAMAESDADVATPIYRINCIEDVTNPNVVKVVRAPDGTALYFSRSPIPYVRDLEPQLWLSQCPFWGHVGVYAYRRNVLQEYTRLPEGQLEGVEKLEQLRLLEARMRIIAVPIDYRPYAVDVPSDLDVVKSMLDANPITL